jgi:hypothetical protein
MKFWMADSASFRRDYEYPLGPNMLLCLKGDEAGILNARPNTPSKCVDGCCPCPSLVHMRVLH